MSRSGGGSLPGSDLSGARSRGGRAALVSVALAVAAAVLPGAAMAIPAGMAYEKVTPSTEEKGYAGVAASSSLLRSSLDGRRFTFQTPAAIAGSEGAIAGNQVLSMLTEDGWVTRGITPRVDPDLLGANIDTQLGYQEFSDDLTRGVMLQGDPVLVAGAAPGLRNLYRRDLPSGGFELLTPPPVNESVENGFAGGIYYAPVAAGVSSDASHVVFESSFVGLTPDAPFGAHPIDRAGIRSAYEWVDGEVRLVGILPDGTPAPEGAVVGRGVDGGIVPSLNSHQYGYGAISDDGTRIFFTTPEAGAPSGGVAGDVYVRLNGTTTKAVSRSQRAVPDPAGPRTSKFMVAAASGGAVFFTSCEKLTDDATAVDPDEQGCNSKNAVNDLYRFDVDSGALRDVSVELPDVDGVIGADRTGESVYFVTLASGETETSGAAAVYLWRNGITHQVASGIYSQDQDFTPTDVLNGTRQAAATTDARYLAFTTSVPQDGQPTDGQHQVYVYDAGADELSCVSCRPVGGGPLRRARLRVTDGQPFKKSYESRNWDSAGRFVFFNTRTALVAEDVNNREDVYRYETATGRVELVSTGVGAYDAIYADNSADGGSVFFVTQQQVIPGVDDDFLADVYVARVGAKAYQPPVSKPPCSGDECQGPLVAPPGDPAPGSSELLGSGNIFAPPGNDMEARPQVSRVGTVRGASVKLRVRVPGRGALRATGKSLVGSRKVARRAGSYRVAVRLSERARRTLVREGRVRVWVTVRFTPSGGETSSVRIAVTFKAKERRKLASSRKGR